MARNSALLIEVPPQPTNNAPETPANAGLTLIEGRADRVDPVAVAMDQALGLEATQPFQTASRWNSQAVEFACSLAPVVCEMFSLAVKACVELQLTWLSWIPGWHSGTGAAETAALEATEQRRDRLAENMDVAVGAEPPQPDPVLLPFPETVDSATLAAAAPLAVQPAEEPEEMALAAAVGSR